MNKTWLTIQAKLKNQLTPQREAIPITSATNPSTALTPFPEHTQLPESDSNFVFAITQWEKFRFNPPPSRQQLEALAVVVGVDVDRFVQIKHLLGWE